MLLSIFSHGFSATFTKTGLTDEQLAQLEKYTAEIQLKELQTPFKNAQVANEWIQVGENLGKALSGCAKELGVEVNNFVKTPVGKVAAFIIIWKLVGTDLTQALLGITLFVGGIIAWLYLYRRTCVIKSVQLGEKRYIWSRRSKEIEYHHSGSVDGTRGAMLGVLLIIIGLSCWITFA
jgi:hypothetical protein